MTIQQYILAFELTLLFATLTFFHQLVSSPVCPFIMTITPNAASVSDAIVGTSVFSSITPQLADDTFRCLIQDYSASVNQL